MRWLANCFTGNTDMTRKDFVLIAKIIKVYRTAIGDVIANQMARDFATELRSTNSAFNRDRFLTACGVE